jgi:hypothetical protein
MSHDARFCAPGCKVISRKYSVVSGLLIALHFEITPSMTASFHEAIRRFDEENSRDPNPESVNAQSRPRELVYAERLSAWVDRLAPDASECLRLAARCQHIRRWEISRNSYPMDRPGYLKWRSDLKQFHASISAEILRKLGFPAETIRRVQELNLKKFPADPDTRILEDALCLVFLQYQFSDLAAKTAPEKVIVALQKSWVKMSEQGRAEALRLSYTETEQRLLASALNSGTGGKT